MTPCQTTALASAGVKQGDAVSASIDFRANIFEMTQAAEDSVLRPLETGAFPHSLRAALAARIARISNDESLAERYLQAAGEHAALADPTHREDDAALLTDFIDKVTQRARDIAAEDIESLKSGGMADADIVRLCELTAFMAYQVRLVAGLRLMRTFE